MHGLAFVLARFFPLFVFLYRHLPARLLVKQLARRFQLSCCFPGPPSRAGVLIFDLLDGHGALHPRVHESVHAYIFMFRPVQACQLDVGWMGWLNLVGSKKTKSRKLKSSRGVREGYILVSLRSFSELNRCPGTWAVRVHSRLARDLASELYT